MSETPGTTRWPARPAADLLPVAGRRTSTAALASWMTTSRPLVSIRLGPAVTTPATVTGPDRVRASAIEIVDAVGTGLGLGLALGLGTGVGVGVGAGVGVGLGVGTGVGTAVGTGVGLGLGV